MIRFIPVYIISQIAVLLVALISVALPQKVADQDGVPGQSKLTNARIWSRYPYQALLPQFPDDLCGNDQWQRLCFRASEMQTVWNLNSVVKLLQYHIRKTGAHHYKSCPSDDAALGWISSKSLSKETWVPNWTARLPFSESFIPKLCWTVIVVNALGTVVSIEPRPAV